MKDNFPDSKSDLFAAFIERCTNLAGPRGAVAMITMQSWMFLSSYEKLRASLLSKQRITSMLHLGARAFDSIGGEVVSSTAFVLANVPPAARGSARKRVGTFIRLVDGTSEAEKVAALSKALEVRAKDAGFHLASDADFTAIPGSPIVYWLSEKVRAAFKVSDRLDSIVITEGQHKTADNDRYLRYGWEVSRSLAGRQARWIPYAKGGPFRRWFGNIDHLVDWSEAARSHYRLDSACRITDPQFWYLPGITWTDITSGGSSFRWMPAGGTFDMSGPVAYLADSNDYSSVLGILNSAFATDVFRILNSTFHLQLRDVRALPMPPEPVGSHEISRGVDGMVSVSRDDWNSCETAWSFTENPLIRTFQSATSERPPRVDSN